MDEKQVRIGIVLVTFNRLCCLMKALESYDRQSILPEYILVVNNHSTDGTEEYLNNWKTQKTVYQKIVIQLEENIGGSGGYYCGLEKAQSLEAEWIWVSDDDAYPEEKALEKLKQFVLDEQDISTISAICGAVIEKNQCAFEHRRYIDLDNPLHPEKNSTVQDYKKEQFEIDAFSYIGTAIHKENLHKTGLPLKEYFILCDDTEHSIRLSKTGRIICVPNIKIFHYPDNAIKELSWKTYYGIRNYYDMLKRHMKPALFSIAYKKKEIAVLKYRVSPRHKEYCQIALAALKDAKNGKLGLHEVYKPGWKMK